MIIETLAVISTTPSVLEMNLQQFDQHKLLSGPYALQNNSLGLPPFEEALRSLQDEWRGAGYYESNHLSVAQGSQTGARDYPPCILFHLQIPQI